MRIPKIIHQIWSGIDEPLPKNFENLGKTWKYHYSDWKYEFWDNDRMNKFITENYPEYWEKYHKLKYNIQRWDVIRYLILNKMGGMYIDFDYESIKPMD
jgi:mannosyltransferase OCH1-like enzyme